MTATSVKRGWCPNCKDWRKPVSIGGPYLVCGNCNHALCGTKPMNTSEAFDAAQKRLETTTIQFENLERLYTERKVTTEALRQSWAEMDEARRELDRICRERLKEAGIL